MECDNFGVSCFGDYTGPKTHLSGVVICEDHSVLVTLYT